MTSFSEIVYRNRMYDKCRSGLRPYFLPSTNKQYSQISSQYLTIKRSGRIKQKDQLVIKYHVLCPFLSKP